MTTRGGRAPEGHCGCAEAGNDGHERAQDNASHARELQICHLGNHPRVLASRRQLYGYGYVRVACPPERHLDSKTRRFSAPAVHA